MTEHDQRFVRDCQRFAERLRDIASKLRAHPPLPADGDASDAQEMLTRVVDLVTRCRETMDRVCATLDRLPRAEREALLERFHPVSLQPADAPQPEGFAPREARILDSGLNEVAENLGLAATLLRNLLDALDGRRDPFAELAVELADAADEAGVLVHELHHTWQTGWMPLQTEVEYDTRGERMGPG
ncbi:MAG TPA: hypothetical protein VIK75_04930 [Calditerricola sp.]